MSVGGVPYLGRGQVCEVKSAWRDALGGAAPGLVDFAERLLLRISPPRWSLEWSLPYWLADAFQLIPQHAFSLTLANVCGLGYVCLQDDLLDHDLNSGDEGQAVALSALLYLHWAHLTAATVGADAWFWSAAAESLAEWGRAVRHSTESEPHPFAQCTEEDFRLLAYRGAPLKLCVAAACSLACCEGLLPGLSAALDQLMTAEVLLDHAHDWEQDLRRGRYNLFLSYISPTPQSPARLPEHEHAVLAEWVTGRAAGPYFDEMDCRLAAAAESALLAGLPPLAAHNRLIADALRRGRQVVLDRVHAALHAAVSAIWTTTSPGSTDNEGQEEHPMEMAGASSNDLERMIGKAFMEPDYGDLMLKDPRSAAAQIGVKLSEPQVQQILAIDAAALQKLAAQFRELVGAATPRWTELW